MKTLEINSEKRIYISPEIEFIKLDNEISLVLESEPPVGPDEGASLAPEFMNNDPFKNSMG